MKKLLLAALIIAFAIPAYAEHYQVGFAWEQATANLPNLQKWTLYMMGADVETQAIDIIYTEGAGPTFTSDQEFTIDVLPDQPVTRTFALTAWSKNGNETAPSIVASHSFEKQWEDVDTPQNFRITGVLVVGDYNMTNRVMMV